MGLLAVHVVLNRMEKFVEPGAARHGNFINYYEFNSAADRLNLLPRDTNLWKTLDENQKYLVLDIGCNSGDLTQLLYKFLESQLPNNEIIVLGIDIDQILIERAIESNKYSKNIFYHCSNIMEYSNSDNNDVIKKHLQMHNKLRFDAVCCFSVTMWIHLNNGDDGLKHFLRSVAGLSELLVIEPQPWKCYRNAVRRMKRAKKIDTFPLYLTLAMQSSIEDDIKSYILEDKELNICFESDPTKWKRKIFIFKRKSK